MTAPPASVTVYPADALRGALSVPGDKSISHRAAMLSGLARGTSTLEGFLRCEDCFSTLKAVCALGASSYCPLDGGLRIVGTAGRMLQPAQALDMGNSGTTTRLLAGLVAGHPIQVELVGDASLQSRPMKRIKEPLERMGAAVELMGEGGTAPLRIQGGALKAIRYRLPVASAQVKSCVLLAGLFAKGVTTVVEPRPTRDHTERLLRAAGVNVEVEGNEVRVTGSGPSGPALAGLTWQIPGDFSSAAFLLVAAAARPGSDLTLHGVGLNPRRTALLDVLQRMGAHVEAETTSRPSDPEPFGTVRVTGAMLRATDVGGDEVPNLIDELPLVAVAGALAEGTTVIRDAAELRIKESDRIASMAENLRRLGVKVEEEKDGLRVVGGAPLRATEMLRSFGDHRIAMCCAVLGLFAEEPVTLQDVACIETSYPGFWTDLSDLGVRVE